jgi:hypothetical protein
MFRKIVSLSIFKLSALFFLFILLISISTTGKGFNDHFDVLVSITSFLFGIFISFSITSRRSRIDRINELFKIDEANFVLIYKLCGQLEHGVVDKVRNLIDKQYIDQIDYILVDYKKSSKSFYDIYDYFLSIKPSGSYDERIWGMIMGLLGDSAASRKQVETLVTQRITRYEWVSLLGLFSLIVFFVLYLNDGSILSILLSTILTTVAFILTLVLRDLNNLKWQNNSWIWDPLHNFFLTLGLLPYYPEDVIKYKEVLLPKTGKIRVAHFPHKYPDISGKKVETIDLSIYEQ